MLGSMILDLLCNRSDISPGGTQNKLKTKTMSKRLLWYQRALTPFLELHKTYNI